MVTSNSDLRGILKVQGVESQENWLLVFTAAPAGVVFTVQLSLVPRVTVAQPASARAAAEKIRILMVSPSFPQIELSPLSFTMAEEISGPCPSRPNHNVR